MIEKQKKKSTVFNLLEGFVYKKEGEEDEEAPEDDATGPNSKPPEEGADAAGNDSDQRVPNDGGTDIK